MNNDVNMHKIIISRAESIPTENCRIICPYCGPTRKKKNEKTLSVTKFTDRFVYNCHHCEESGAIRNMSNITYIKKEKTPTYQKI